MSARLDLDQRGVGKWVTRGMAVLAVVAFLTGAGSLVEVGRWAGLGVASFGVPVVLDLGLVLMAISAAVARHRGTKAGLLWFSVVLLTGLSVAAQTVHSMTVATVNGPALWVAVAVGACPPVVTLLATESWIRLAVTEPRPRVQKPVSQPVAQPATETVAETAAPRPVRKPATVTKLPTTSTRPSREQRAAVAAQARELLDTGLSMAKAAEQLGVPRSSLIRWLDAAA